MQNFTELFNISRAAAQQPAAMKDFSHQVYITQDNAPRTIYLADLPKSITYLELSEFFEKNIGPCVISIKRPMFKDFYFAFVQFQKLDDARKARDEFKFPTLCGVKCRILPFNKTQLPSGANLPGPMGKKPSKNTQLFVKGLPRTWTHDDLNKAFEKFGKILSCKVSIDAEHQSRQYGFVQLETERACQDAIKKMNDHVIPESEEHQEAKLTVCEFVPRLDRIGTTKPRCSTNLYVKNFPQDEDFTEDQLRHEFEKFGELVNVCIMRDEDKKSKLFGFVCFHNSEDAQRALDHYQQSRQDDKENQSETPQTQEKRLYVCEAKSKQQRKFELEKSTYHFKRSMHLLNLIVKNVDPEVTKEEFQQYFQNFGEVKSSKLMPEASIGFVCFQDRESARMAKEQPELVLRGRKMHADFCEPKESRQKRQEEQWDRQQYNKQKASQMNSNNQDVISLITSLSLLMSQLNNKNGGNRMGNGNGGHQGGNSFNGGHQGGARFANRQGGNNYQPKMQQQQQQFQGQQNFQQQMPNQMPPVSGQQQQQHYQNRQQPMSMPMPQPNMQQTPGYTPQPQQTPGNNTPQGANNEVTKYRNEIMGIFMGEKFMNASDPQKKQILGTHIFRYVTNLVTPEYSPKITGMIIDLPIADLNYSVSTLETLQLKVRSAIQLLVDTGNMQEQQAQQLPVWQQTAGNTTQNQQQQKQTAQQVQQAY